MHEHWNNSTDIKYTRNLGTGASIELIDIEQTTPTNTINKKNDTEYFHLPQNYPNPFNLSKIINYQLKTKSCVQLTFFDITGQEVKKLVNQNPGNYSVFFNASNFASGIYIYRVVAGS